jgi:hypothetical protein
MTTTPVTPLIPVFFGDRCVGHLLRNARGAEAFDRSDRSLGAFPTVDDAAAALWRARNEVQP